MPSTRSGGESKNVVATVSEERTQYRFGPLERRGLIAGWRGGQIASVAISVAVAILTLHGKPSPLRLVVALVTVAGGIGFACWPLGGRTAEEWAPTIAHWGTGVVTGDHHHRATVPESGHTSGERTPIDRGPGRSGDLSVTSPSRNRGPFAGLDLLSIPFARSGIDAGVIADRRGHTVTAVLQLEGQSVALLDPGEKERRVAGWSSVLASLSRENTAVHRLSWIASSVPDDGRAMRDHLTDHAAIGPDTPARQSYQGLLDGTGTGSAHHEVMLCVQVRVAGSTALFARRGQRTVDVACLTLEREVDQLRRLLGEVDVTVVGVVDANQLASTIRRSGDASPVTRRCGPRHLRETPWPWPMAMDVDWGFVRTDATWHATYWIAEWPRVEVGPDFLAPLLLGSVRRSVALTMEPLSPQKALRQVEQARTADIADTELRRRGGFLATARRARQADVVTRREIELADGHGSFRFSGYVTVTTPHRELLEEACDLTEQSAAQCRLDIRRIWGEQERAFLCTLPLARGLS